MSTHTPGPWGWSPTGASLWSHGGWDSDGLPVLGRCTEALIDDGEEWDIEPADARLIAAAPDLLAACKAALGAFENNNCIDWGDLEKAIAKAEGEKP